MQPTRCGVASPLRAQDPETVCVTKVSTRDVQAGDHTAGNGGEVGAVEVGQ